MTAADMRTVADLLPPVPAPPFDPRSVLLDGRAGWRAATLDRVEVDPGCAALALAPLPGTAATLADPRGGFGGLTPPTGTALLGTGGDGRLARLFFLDPTTGIISELDACACAVRPLPCTRRAGSGARELRDPHAMAVDGRRLYVCDTGNGQVAVIALASLAVTAHWRAAPTTARPAPFAPWGAAVDGRGRLWVSDASNGALVAFDRDGRVVASVTGLGTVRDVAVDRDGRIFVRVEGLAPAVLAVSSDTLMIESVVGPGAVASGFAPLPFTVDTAGRLDVSALCAAACGGDAPGPALFEPSGKLAPSTPAPWVAAYPPTGMYLSEALDSQLPGCTWHRVVLDGELPRGGSVEVATFTAETPYTDEQITALPDSQWETRQVARQLVEGRWDCLVRGAPGRYLWLRLGLRSHGSETPRLARVVVEFPRVSLRGYLPAIFGADPVGADFTDRFLALFDTTLRGLERRVDRVAALFDPLSAPVRPGGPAGGDFLDWLASWVGLTVERAWSEPRRRRWLRGALELYELRGTREGLRRQLLLLLGWTTAGERCPPCPRDRCAPPPAPCEGEPRPSAAWLPPPLVLEHFRLRRWMFLGAGRLGDEAVVWGHRIVNRTQLGEGAQVGVSQLDTARDPARDPLHLHAHRFSVFVPARYGRDESERRTIERLVRRESPAHTRGQIEWVAPRFRVGVQSTIGFDSIVARLPEGVTLGDGAALGQATVLKGGRGTTVPQIGASARIGGGATLS